MCLSCSALIRAQPNFVAITGQPFDEPLLPVASQPDVIEACLTIAASAAKIALEKSVDDAFSGLQLAQTQAIKISERDLIRTCCRALLN